MKKKNLLKINKGASPLQLCGLLTQGLIGISAQGLLALLFLFFTISSTTTQAQTLNLIPHPAANSSYGHDVINFTPFTPIALNGKVYFYYSIALVVQLAEWNGTSLSIIPNPSGLVLKHYSPPIIFNGNLYLSYVNSSSKSQLAKYDGTTLSLIENANPSDGGYQGSPIIFNNELYINYLTANNKGLLAKYSGTGTTLTYIPNANPSDGGYGGSPIIMNNELYLRYANASNKSQLAKFDGISISLIANDNINDFGYENSPIVMNNELYIRYRNASNKYQLAKYSGTGTALTLITNDNINDYGYGNYPIVMNNELYIEYRNANNKYQLAKYNGTGTTLNLIANANLNDFGFAGSPIVMNNVLYIRYGNSSNKLQLAKYDGTSLSLIENASPSDQGHNGYPIIFNNELYIKYLNASNKGQLAKYSGTGTTLTYIPNSNANDLGFYGRPFVLNNALYIQYQTAYKSVLAKYDGTNISTYNNPDAGHGYYDVPFVSNNQIFLRYINSSNNYQIAYLNTCATTYDTINVSICDGSSYTFNGIAQSTAGTYLDTLVNAGGCDSIITLNLSLKSVTTSTTNLTICSHELPYSWNGLSFTAAGTQTAHLTNSVGCDSAATLNLSVTPSTVISTTNMTACGSYTWNGNTYTQSGTYISPISGCDIHVLNLTITHELLLSAKVFLSGPYDAGTGKMHDSLRVKGLIPTLEPYTAAPFNKAVISELAGETVSSSVLAITGDNAIVDWVFVELRSSSNSANVVATKRALIQRDGDIVSAVDGVSPVPFFNMPNDNYYVSIKHRNHLGIITLNTIAMSSCIPSVIDFTNSANVYTIPSQPTNTNYPARKQIGSTYLMWSGDARNNKNIKYNGLNNDKDFVLTSLGGAGFINSTLNLVYRSEDNNMDGKVRYNNTDNDRVLILSNLGNLSNNIINQHTPN